MPSVAEGYDGLPPIEAKALGTPVICNALPIYRETLGTLSVYVTETDRHHWRQALEQMLTADPVERSGHVRSPDLGPAFQHIVKADLIELRR